MSDFISDKNKQITEVRENGKRKNLSNTDMGAPHKRERIWIVAYSELSGDRTSGNAINGYREEKIKVRTDKPQFKFDRQVKDVADTDSERCEEPYAPAVTEIQRFNSWTTIENARCKYGEEGMQEQRGLQRQQKERNTCDQFKRPSTTRIWDEAIESRIAGMDDGLSRKLDGDRLRGLGNAIVPQIAELLFNQIKGLIDV